MIFLKQSSGKKSRCFVVHEPVAVAVSSGSRFPERNTIVFHN
jgi:hypothetical protein